jgi:hypothetical protein
MIQTINLRDLTYRLLRKQPDLSVWVQVCEVYIDASVPLDGDFLTRLVIECRFPAIANLFAKNIHRLLGCLITGIPIPIYIKYQNELIAAYRPIQHLQLKSIIRGFTMLTSTIDTQSHPTTKQSTIDLTQIPAPMQEMVREHWQNPGINNVYQQ